MNTKPIKSALISVFDKDGLEEIVKIMHALGIIIYSTGGTQKFIENLKIPVISVEDITTYPSILGGRVKTLHPKVFGGILSRRGLEEDNLDIKEYEIPEIDLVIVDLYPFEDTLASGAPHDDIIEKIDIGGVSLIRAAGKNAKDVVVVPSKDEYCYLKVLLEKPNPGSTQDDRDYLAHEAFMVSSGYDTAIGNYMKSRLPEGIGTEKFRMAFDNGKELRYGENPHQTGMFFGDFDSMFDQVYGKELSYNNLADVASGLALMAEFSDADPTFAIIKHQNACGIATRITVNKAYLDALAGDPTSAFGGILISNTEVDEATALEIKKLFCEVLVSPSFTEKALEILKEKKDIRILIQKDVKLPLQNVTTILNGILVQDPDNKMLPSSEWICKTVKKGSSSEVIDLEFALKLVKHTKSNCIVFAKDGQLCASGTGQTSRIDALRQAVDKAQDMGFNLNGAVMASDAFFPFPDCVEFAHKAGISAVVQPGRSIKDQLSIDYCNEHGVAMYVTGFRHFKH